MLTCWPLVLARTKQQPVLFWDYTNICLERSLQRIWLGDPCNVGSPVAIHEPPAPINQHLWDTQDRPYPWLPLWLISFLLTWTHQAWGISGNCNWAFIMSLSVCAASEEELWHQSSLPRWCSFPDCLLPCQPDLISKVSIPLCITSVRLVYFSLICCSFKTAS